MFESLSGGEFSVIVVTYHSRNLVSVKSVLLDKNSLGKSSQMDFGVS